MLQPSSSGVMHAYVKERAREGMGTAVPARARLHTRNACTGMHGTGCACRCLRELLALRRSAASTRPALVVDCGIFRKLPCLQTRYIVERAADASLMAEIDPAQPLASVRSANPRAKTLLNSVASDSATGCLTIGGKVVFQFGSDVPENLESSRPWSVY